MIALRSAGPEDCERVWEWNFSPEVRAVSLDARCVTFTEHVRWFQRKLDDRNGKMWIVEEHGVPAGVVRLDRRSDGTARISIALGKRARGHGVGRRAIAAACAAWAGPIVAEIRTENTVSRSCFTACNFACVAEAEGLATYRWSP